MKKNNFIWLSIFTISLSALFFACNEKAPEYPVEPKIEFLRLSKSTFNAVRGANVPTPEDSILVTIKFEDGDGDLGTEDKKDYTLAYTDPRYPIGDGNPTTFTINTFPQNGVGKAISGEITAKIKGLCCTLGCDNTEQPPTELVPFKLFIKDRAGHKSNEIVLPLITIPCPQ
jgi:hypothetical protein